MIIAIKKIIKNSEKIDTVLLSYWILYTVVFLALENREVKYHIIESSLDKYIPFNSLFVIPYVFWFFYVGISLIYTFIKHKAIFRKQMLYIIVGYSICLVSYIVYPNMQIMRPEVLGTSIFDKVVNFIYSIDTNTNVCPSIHVVGSIIIMYSMNQANIFKKNYLKIINFIVCALICSSTLFLKQHSFIDLSMGIVVSYIAYIVVKQIDVSKL